MRSKSALILVLLVSILSFADSSLTARRDAALKAVNACVQRKEVSSRECKKLNANVQTLVDCLQARRQDRLADPLQIYLPHGFLWRCPAR